MVLSPRGYTATLSEVAIHGHTWPRRATYGLGDVWPCMALLGHTWPYVARYGRAGRYMSIHAKQVMHSHMEPNAATYGHT